MGFWVTDVYGAGVEEKKTGKWDELGMLGRQWPGLINERMAGLLAACWF